MADERFEEYKARLMPKFEADFAEWVKQIGALAPEGRWRAAFHNFALQWYVKGHLTSDIAHTAPKAE